MNRMSPSSFLNLSRTSATAIVVISLLVVGWIDFITGTEIRIVPLYFVPLLLAGWNLGAVGAALSALLAVTVWLAVMYASGVSFQASHTWVISAVTEGSEFLFVSILIAGLRNTLDREAALSRTDQLTGLLNRRAMTESFLREVALSKRNGRAASLVSIDLNNFKHANDRFGHHRGDELLRQCANLLRESLRTSDIIARIGGDEFVVFLPETGAEQTAALVERIRRAVDSASDFRLTGVTLSIGTFSEAPVASDLEALLRGADALMYEAKRQGNAEAKLHARDSQARGG
jgi:diguanylate cyclase (GGDEF)-like protein